MILILEIFKPTQAILENACPRAYTIPKFTVSITTKFCHNVMVIVEGLTASNKKELLYLYPSDIGC